MRLTNEQIQRIEKFFGKNINLKERFVELYNYQLSFVPELIFDMGDGNIVGFKRPGERFFAYIYKQGLNYYFKTPNNSGVSFSAASISTLKYELTKNHTALESAQTVTQNNDTPLIDLSEGIVDMVSGGAPERLALEEEVINAGTNYKALKSEIEEAKKRLPYPDVTPYSVAHDYNEIANLQSQKRSNKPFWETINEATKYYNLDNLYSGHLKIGDCNYYFMPTYLDNKHLKLNGERVVLLSMDKAENNDLFKLWRFPKKDAGITFSRNVEMRNRTVDKVDIIYDAGDDLYSDITDLYLRNALMRNKENGNTRSIIQTIQEKQNEIRTFDVNTPFVVQGCAGSGKTMVLLHRLRYLLVNNFVKRNNYILLVPSRSFKKYILKITSEFSIDDDSIVAYTDYLRLLSAKQYEADFTELDESIFPKEYLSKVYSKAFISKCFAALVDDIVLKTEKLTDLCESRLTKILEQDKQALTERNAKIFAEAQKAIALRLEPIKDSDDCQNADDFSQVPTVIERLTHNYTLIKERTSRKKMMTENFEVPSEILEEYFSQDQSVVNMRMQIVEQEHRVETASFFTALSHKRKLRELQEEYSKLLSEIKEKAYQIEKSKFIESIPIEDTSYFGITLDKLNEIINGISEIYDSANAEAKQCENELEYFERQFELKYSKEIESLQCSIELSAQLKQNLKDALTKLDPCFEILKTYIRQISDMIDLFKKYPADKKEEKAFGENSKLFLNKTDNAIQGYLYTALLNKSRKFLKQEFSIILCDKYKHYWHLAAWFNYLVRSMVIEPKKFVYIDEAQDLSQAEIELIHRYNEISQPVINLFGDINQEITDYGIKNWCDIPYASKLFALDENFRNTNQIVNFCNRNLPFKMRAVGVEQEDVGFYKNLNEATYEKSAGYNWIFIVKDEYAFDDFTDLVKSAGLTKFDVYTVKAVKGLEFKEVFVFEQGMTINERYIAYTRALSKLNIIGSLPTSKTERPTKIVQGEDTDED